MAYIVYRFNKNNERKGYNEGNKSEMGEVECAIIFRTNELILVQMTHLYNNTLNGAFRFCCCLKMLVYWHL